MGVDALLSRAYVLSLRVKTMFNFITVVNFFLERTVKHSLALFRLLILLFVSLFLLYDLATDEGLDQGV